MKRIFLLLFAALLATGGFAAKKKKVAPAPLTPAEYEARGRQIVKDAISKLTLEEKLAQLQSGSIYIIEQASDEEGNLSIDSLRKYYPHGVGLMNIDFANSKTQERYCRQLNSLKKYNASLPHAVPILFIGEGLHGLMGNGATVFPQAISLGCSFDTAMVRKVYDATALEAHSRGIRMFFSPILDLAREPRFGRIEEMYSEDPYLCGMLGSQAVRSFQKMGSNGELYMAATLKHYMGHGQVEGGRNVAAYPGNYNDLLNNHALPFEMAIKAGTACVMPAYNDVCDIPVTVNKFLLQDVLRGKLGFKGAIISDQNAVDVVNTVNHIAPDLRAAAELAIAAGIDVDIIGAEGTYQMLKESVEEGRVSESLLDRSLENVFWVKYRLGLFDEDNPADIKFMQKVNNSAEHKQVAREAAQKTMVLLENDGILPLDGNKKLTIAVMGQNATELPYGGYTAEPKYPGVSILDGIKNYAQGKNIEVLYALGCQYSVTPGQWWGNNNNELQTKEVNDRLLQEAVEVAKKADVVVLCVGENESFCREAWGEIFHVGDRDDLHMLGYQDEFIEAIKKVGKPVVTMVTGGRPLLLNKAKENSNALVQCFYIGQEGGNAAADLLFGEKNFEGKLSVSMPRSTGSLPCYYNRKPNRFRSYIFEPTDVDEHCLYPFGYGKSYSTFEVSAPVASKKTYSQNEEVKVSCTVKNTSAVDGAEVVQLYIHDELSTCVRPVKEMRGFQKVQLKAGEEKTIDFTLSKNDLMYYDSTLNKVFEPGEFKIMVGNSSVNLKDCIIIME
ncbi:MAG: glycoside hydrolase family 3 C-terminal domain-containing protein [Bacteroidaceae bacterium]|nr:glycoside hydrolase family 3 C-terminal domain-containing protein [Bacteroidaceae bacterium]